MKIKIKARRSSVGEIKSKNIVGTVSAAPAMKLVRGSHTLRVKWEKLGVGLLSCGSWVADKVNPGVAAKLQSASITTVRSGFQILTGRKGMLVRQAKLSNDGKTYTVGTTRCSTELFPASACRLLSVNQMRDFVKSNGFSMKFKHGESEVTGWVLGPRDKDYATALFVKGGKLHTKDIETRKNLHNAHEVVRVMTTDKNDDARKAVLAVL